MTPSLSRRRRTATLLAAGGVFSALLFGCPGKKDRLSETEPDRPAGPVASVRVTPDRSAPPELITGSNQTVPLAAQAFNAEGLPIAAADFNWRFHLAPVAESGLERDGHTLEKTGPAGAVFRASGAAAGDYWVRAELPDCVDADSVEAAGLARITVAPAAGAPAGCGRLRVRYGSRDLVDESVLGFVTLNLWAEVYASPELPDDWRVRFYLNGRMIKPERGLFRPLDEAPAQGYPAHWRARMPVFFERDSYTAWFELRQADSLVCRSASVSFRTR